MKVDIGGVVVYVDDLDQLDRIIDRYSNRNQHKQIASPEVAQKALPIVAAAPVAAIKDANAKAHEQDAPAPEARRRGSARYVPQVLKIQSASKKEALLKIYNALGVSTHQAALRALAAKGEDGLYISDLKKVLGVPESYKISGFTAALTRRAPAYGLTGEDVVIVEFLGAVGGKRIYKYHLSQEMAEVLREQGLVAPTKA